MSKIKEFYFEEINRVDDIIDADYQYQMWLEEQLLEKYFQENKEKMDNERIFNSTHTYPF